MAEPSLAAAPAAARYPAGSRGPAAAAASHAATASSAVAESSTDRARISAAATAPPRSPSTPAASRSVRASPRVKASSAAWYCAGALAGTRLRAASTARCAAGASPRPPLHRGELRQDPRRQEVVGAALQRGLEQAAGLREAPVQLGGHAREEERRARRVGVGPRVALEHRLRLGRLAAGEEDVGLQLERLGVTGVEREPPLGEGDGPLHLPGRPAGARGGGEEPAIVLGPVQLRVEDADRAGGVGLQPREPQREPCVRVAGGEGSRLPRHRERLGAVPLAGDREQDPGVGRHQLGALRRPLAAQRRSSWAVVEILTWDRLDRLARDGDDPPGERVEPGRIRDERVAEGARRLGDPLREIRGERLAPRRDPLVGHRPGVEPRARRRSRARPPSTPAPAPRSGSGRAPPPARRGGGRATRRARPPRAARRR